MGSILRVRFCFGECVSHENVLTKRRQEELAQEGGSGASPVAARLPNQTRSSGAAGALTEAGLHVLTLGRFLRGCQEQRDEGGLT